MPLHPERLLLFESIQCRHWDHCVMTLVASSATFRSVTSIQTPVQRHLPPTERLHTHVFREPAQRSVFALTPELLLITPPRTDLLCTVEVHSRSLLEQGAQGTRHRYTTFSVHMQGQEALCGLLAGEMHVPLKLFV